MPVVDHPIHEHGVRDSDHRYGCFNRKPFKKTVVVENWKGVYRWPFVMSMECRYDNSLTDSRCAGCKHAGSGEAYIAQQNNLITENQHASKQEAS